MSFLETMPPAAVAVGNASGFGGNASLGIGFGAAGVSVLFFGSNFVPVKQFDTHDGAVFQFFLCAGIWLVGVAVSAARGFPTFHPLVMLGGALWTTGNLCTVPIIHTLGLGLGILIWGTFNMLSGWASGRFGWFDVPAQVPRQQALNYTGVGLALLASVVIFFVEPQLTASADLGEVADSAVESSEPGRRRRPPYQRHASDQENSVPVYEEIVGASSVANVNEPFDSSSERLHHQQQQQQQQRRRLRRRRAEDRQPIVDSATTTEAEASAGSRQLPWLRLTPSRRRLLGISLAILVGPMYGLSFAPTYYVQSHTAGASLNGLDYVLPHFTGILCASTCYLVLYCCLTRNRPLVNASAILPSLVSGVMWGVATSAWFLANQILSETVAFPIITTAPAVVAAVWGVAVFKEIRGIRNLLLLALAFCITAAGSVLNGLSR